MLGQAKFAAPLGVAISTLHNRAQGRREPAGLARALLYALSKDTPSNVVRVLAA